MTAKLLILCALATSLVAPAVASSPSAPASRLAFGQRVLSLVNDARRAKGLGPLTPNGRLSAAAQVLADDLAASGDFDHHDSRGHSVTNRLDAQGYRWRTAGENLAKGQQSPEQVVDSWLHSTKHRQNIMSSEFKDFGLGVADCGGQLVWVQVFGASF